jgi:hypothetical protein
MRNITAQDFHRILKDCGLMIHDHYIVDGVEYWYAGGKLVVAREISIFCGTNYYVKA